MHAKALLRGALGQQSAVILICMAVDRYMCALHPEKYHQLSSKKVSFYKRSSSLRSYESNLIEKRFRAKHNFILHLLSLAIHIVFFFFSQTSFMFQLRALLSDS